MLDRLRSLLRWVLETPQFKSSPVAQVVQYYPSDQALQDALSSKFGIKSIPSEIAAREKYLSEIRDKGVCSREEVRKAILEYYQS